MHIHSYRSYLCLFLLASICISSMDAMSRRQRTVHYVIAKLKEISAPLMKSRVAADRMCSLICRYATPAGVIKKYHAYGLMLTLQHMKNMQKETLRSNDLVQAVLDLLQGIYSFPTLADDAICSICRQKPEGSFVTLTCNHVFCYECLFEWFTNHEEGSNPNDSHRRCPNCRKRINKFIQMAMEHDTRYARIIHEKQQARKAEAAQENEEFGIDLEDDVLIPDPLDE